MKRKRTEVTIETDEIWIIRRSENVNAAWCPQCCQEVQMITADEAAILTHLSALAIYGRVEAGLIHYTEMPGGLLLVCTNSIMRQINPRSIACDGLQSEVENEKVYCSTDDVIEIE